MPPASVEPRFKISEEKMKNNSVLKHICDSSRPALNKLTYRNISCSNQQKLFS